MQPESIRDLVVTTLEDMKAFDIATLDVRGKTSITDYFVIASGNSDRHVKSSAESVAFQAKQAGEAAMAEAVPMQHNEYKIPRFINNDFLIAIKF